MITIERKKLELALEALEAGDWYIGQLEMIVYSSDDTGTHEDRAKVQAAITTLKEALAQPAQEPVAWMHEWEDGERVPKLHPSDDRLNDQPTSVRPLVYGDAAPPQRPWVGLTFAEICEGENDSLLKFARTIEAKLKEKNT